MLNNLLPGMMKNVHVAINSSNPVDVAAVVVTGLVVVFVALIILILLVWLYAKVFDYIRNSNKKKNQAPPAPKVALVKKEEPVEEPVEEETVVEDDTEIIAVISAVIAQISSETGVQYKINSVKPVVATDTKAVRRSLWAQEGRRSQMLPF